MVVRIIGGLEQVGGDLKEVDFLVEHGSSLHLCISYLRLMFIIFSTSKNE